MGFSLSNFGNFVGGIGRGLNLPEMGISELLGGTRGGFDPGIANYTSIAKNNVVTGGNPVQIGQAPQSSQPTGNGTAPITNNGGYGSGGGGGGRSGGATFDPASLIEAQDALRQANWYLGQLDPQRQQFLNNLSSTFNNYRTNLQNEYGRNKGQFDQSTTTANQNRVSANNTIDGKVRQRANSLQRLMGTQGAGDSEAAQMYAPYAAARTGSQLRNQVNQQYGQTMSDLNFNWGQYQTDYDNNLKSLADQETNNRNSKLAEFLQRQFDLENQKRQAEAAVNYAQTGNAAAARAAREAALPRMYQLLQEITALGNQQVTPTVKDATYEAKPVDQFTVADPGDIQGVEAPINDTTSPYYQWLLKQRDQDNQFFGY